MSGTTPQEKHQPKVHGAQWPLVPGQSCKQRQAEALQQCFTLLTADVNTFLQWQGGAEQQRVV